MNNFLNTNKYLQVITKKIFQHKKKSSIIILLGIFFFGYCAGSLEEKNNFKDFIATFKNIREQNTKFSYISPLLGSVSAPATDIGIYANLKDSIYSYLEQEKNNGNLYDYSFYFKDLNSPLWFGVNEDKSFFPASLFKLPIAIAIYEQGERESFFLDRLITYTPEIAAINKMVALNEDSVLVVGNSYSVKDLVKILLEQSDNGAKDLLLNVLNKKYFLELLDVVSINDPTDKQNFEISSEEYALFLRILYNSSYLNEEHSEYLLSLLSKSEFTQGMVAGIPSTVKVAHKFGTYSAEEKINTIEVKAVLLHDCGIVYVKDDPFVLCFMTKGKNVESLFEIIKHVSQMVYEEENN